MKCRVWRSFVGLIKYLDYMISNKVSDVSTFGSESVVVQVLIYQGGTFQQRGTKCNTVSLQLSCYLQFLIAYIRGCTISVLVT